MSYLIHNVVGQTDSLALLRQRTPDGLLDPPRRIGRELGPFVGVKTFNTLHQPDVPLIDEVEQRQAEPFVITGDFYHKAQVRLNHMFAGGLITLADPAGKSDFLLGCQQIDFAYLPEIQLKRIASRPSLRSGFVRLRKRNDGILLWRGD